MYKRIKHVFKLIKEFSIYFYVGWKHHLTWPYFRSFVKLSMTHINQVCGTLYTKGIQIQHSEEDRVRKLKVTASGLHTLLPADPLYTYSILLHVHKPNSPLFRKGLQSILHQTAASMEILIGCEEGTALAIEDIEQAYPGKIKIFHFESQNKDLILNALAKKATGNFFLLVDQEDWLRPDLIFRYEQTLRLVAKPKKTILYCYENRISKKDCFVPLSEKHKPLSLTYPYVFEFLSEKGLLIPRELWEQAGGLRYEYKGAEYEDLLLRLDTLGAIFQCIPISLYSVREKVAQKNRSQIALLRALKDYAKVKQLHWNWEEGYTPNSVRAIPKIIKQHQIQVVIPFKDQKELTLKCIHSLLKQQGIQLKITAVDNRSQDVTIAEEIRSLGGEVLSIDEPFNFSRLNNLAVKNTQIASDCDVVLFLNNDVELEPEAILEMLRWIDQPHIGMVGCRLHYPDGRLQHGGVTLDRWSPAMRWEHTEKLRSFETMDLTKKLRVFDAVTAACALIKRQTFLEVGGFDEVWYPIGYSDTNLAVKLQAKGLWCFYTPHAVGIHHESVSRKANIEDYENSWWLHHLWLKSQHSSL